jgi:FdhE protein
LPNASLESLARLKTGAPEALESTADMILNADYGRIDLAAAPFVGAALQVYWTVLASKIPVGDVRASFFWPALKSGWR